MENPNDVRVANPPERPVMVFDGDCGFCRYWIGRWRCATGDRVDYEPYQETAARYPEIPRDAFEHAVQFIEPDGRVTSGADAVFQALEHGSKKYRLLGLLKAVPGVPAMAHIVYRFIADHRSFFSFLTRFFFGRSVNRADYSIARWIFPRMVGVAYLAAFLSLQPQIRGLSGEHGIVPVVKVLQSLTEQKGMREKNDNVRYRIFPTICWYDASDEFLVAMCVAGVVLSCLVIIGLLPGLCLFLLWGIYLSLCSVCEPFLSFQWDTLLLEAGFLTIFLVPPGLWLDWKSESWGSRLARWLLLWLLFCLMFESGVVKLTQGDDSWGRLISLTYHYETQPLPLWTSWYLNQEPLWFEKLSMIFVFVTELGVPFLIFGPRNFRRAACALMILLQLLIAATGNYCFFNLLSIALCLLLLDDDAWPGWLRRKLLRDRGASEGKGIRWPFWAVAPIAVLDLFMSIQQFPDTFNRQVNWPKWMNYSDQVIESFETFNDFGLFRQMTTARPEIIIEGSNDGKTWLPYEFKWKPGDVNRMPGLVAPFQPRLDWQMWFEALNEAQGYRSEWFVSFLLRLKEGSPEVLQLMGSNPFPGTPPRYIRASMYLYKFTHFADHTQAWWKREYLGSLGGISPQSAPPE